MNFIMNTMLCNTTITLCNISELLYRLVTLGQLLFSHMSVVIKYLFFPKFILVNNCRANYGFPLHVCLSSSTIVVHFSIEKVEVDGPDFSDDCPALWALWLFMVCHIVKNLQCTPMAAMRMTAWLNCAKLCDVLEADETAWTRWSLSWLRLSTNSCCRLLHWGR